MKFNKEDLEKLHATALKEFEAIQDKERMSREQAIEDMRFTNVVGAQSEDSFDDRADTYKGEINRVAGLVDQVTGGNRENRSNIKYLPTGDSVNNDTADVKSGLARDIENKSDANTIYDQGFDEAVTGGYGGWRILTEFEDEGFDQVIRLKAIRSAASSLYFNVDANEYTKKDATSAFLVTSISNGLFESQYTDASLTSFPREQFASQYDCGWFSEDRMLVAEYWWKHPVTKTIARLTDGSIIDIEDEKTVIDELEAKGLEIEKTRTVKSHVVYMAKMNGAEWLSEPKEFPSKYIPLIPVYGRIAHIEDETYIRGLIRFAKDAQRIYNYETSNQVQIGAEAMDDPIWATAAQVTGYKDQFETYKTERPAIMIYNSDPATPGAPQRTGAPSVQQGAMMRVKQAEMDIYATTNMYPPSLGLNVGLESGVALRQQDEKGDRGSYVFVDNHMKSIKYTGEMLEDIISRIYDAERVVSILNLDGSVETVDINKVERDALGVAVIDEQTGKEVIVNDLTAKFGTVVDVSPAYNTQKQESLDQLIAMIGADETFRAISTDLLAKNSSVLESDELYKRARKLMIKQGLIDPTEEEIKELGLDQPQPPDPNQTAITDNINMQTEKLMSDIESTDAKTRETQVKMQGEAINNISKMLDAIKLKQETGVPLTPSDIALLRDASAIADLANDDFQTARQPEGNVTPQVTA